MSASDETDRTGQVDKRLATAAWRDSLRAILPSVPALLLVLVLVFLPVGWLAWQSVLGVANELTVDNYARLIETSTYLKSFITTLQISSAVTLICLVLGYPLAYLMSALPARITTVLMFAVLLPYWTSILVRTYAWLILLQRRGLLNQWLLELRAIHEPLPLVYNFTGTVIGMVHIMLPFFVLPLYGVMTQIDRTYMVAASSLGATPSAAFRRVYLPLSLPGVLAGAFLVFVLSIGFYVTPAILGGGRVIMVAQQIEKALSLYANWGAASALGMALLILTACMLVFSAAITRLLMRSLR